MGISTMFYRKIEYFRIYRAWHVTKNKQVEKIERQEYVRIREVESAGKTATLRKKSFDEAVVIDGILAEQQRIALLIKHNNAACFFHPTGKIIGINRVCHTVSTKTYTPFENHIFDIRYNPRKGKKISHGQVKITKNRTLKEHYIIAVDKFMDIADISHNKVLRKLMISCFKYYKRDPSVDSKNFKYDGRGKTDDLPILKTPIQIEFDEVNKNTGISSNNIIASNLKKELDKFLHQSKIETNKTKRNIKIKSRIKSEAIA